MLRKITVVAVALLISSVIYAGAQDIKIDFDGKKSFSFSERITSEIANLEIKIPEVDSLNKKTKIPKEWAIKEWTIMVFVNAKNNLEEYGLKDVNEMEMVGSSDKVNIVVEMGRMDGFDSSEGDWIGTRRYLIQKDGNPNAVTSPVVQDLGKVDMGDWKQLVDFGKWTKTNYPAKKYMLIVWNHGSGWDKNIKFILDRGLSYDDETHNHFTTPQLGMAINEIGRLDVYGSDACLMQMASVDYEIKDSVAYIVGSEETEPGDGYTYNTMLEPIVSNPTLTPYQAAKVLVDAYSDHYQGLSYAYTQSLVKTSALPKLLTLMNDWVYAVGVAGDKEIVKNALLNAQSYAMKDNKDLYHFVSLVCEKTASAAVKEKGEVLMSYIKGGVVKYNRWSSSSGGWWGPDDYSNSHGIAVYLPKYSYNKSYDELKWAKYSNWDEFIKWYTAKDAEKMTESKNLLGLFGAAVACLESENCYEHVANYVEEQAAQNVIDHHSPQPNQENFGYDYITTISGGQNFGLSELTK
ncbi:MAG: clostripain-related cysteine peptidase [Elusimicrobia bacterium]|nr:clostripain-related cysteine peptidase [Elusimicrobiota bacterium]